MVLDWVFGTRMDFSTVIVFSSLDDRFIDQCIDSAVKVSNKVVLVCYRTLFDGTDDMLVAQQIIDRNKHKNVEFCVYDLPEIENYNGNPQKYLINLRIKGFNKVKDSAGFTMFLDGDEVLDIDVTTQWKKHYKTIANSIKLSSYWYFRQPTYQRDTIGSTPLVLRNSYFEKYLENNPDILTIQEKDRSGWEFRPARRTKEVLVHHYAWVKSKEEMLKKVTNWGHKDEDDWVNLVEKEFEREFDGTCVIHGYRYNIVPNKFNIRTDGLG